MKVPFSWLKEFVDIDVTAQELEEKLFSCGFEVEELIPLDAGISKVVVGKIVEMEKQEGTHLTKCVVDCGAYGHEIRISTGAANMKLGDCVPTALDGSTLPGGITIKARKMQGVESNGMLCSGAELGLNDDLFPGSEVYGLLILPEDSVPGTDIAPVVGLDDYIFDISITANRPDCQSVLGIAREVAAVLGKPLHMPAMDYKAVCEPDAPITVKVEAPELCPRYMAHYVRNIRMGESPRWMKRHLALCGLRSISNVVDSNKENVVGVGGRMQAVELDEVEKLEEVLPLIWDALSPEARTVIEEQGVVYTDCEGDLVTSIVNNKDCVFTCYDDKGCCYCAIEKAYREGRTNFYKPISCHLYPIRVGNYGLYKAVNYHRWDVCKAAMLLGQKENLPVYKFLKEPLIRKFGEDWYAELELVVEEMKKQGIL